MSDWLTLPEVAELLHMRVSEVRELLREQHLVAMRRGENNALYIPAHLLFQRDDEWQIVPGLRGTVIVLADASFTDTEIVTWLLTENELLGGTPISHLRAGHKAPVRRAALMEN